MRLFFLISVLVCFSLAHAQESLNKKIPFVGTIGYKLTYSSFPKDRIAHLPDSMTLWSNPPIIRVKWHGGLADTLQTEIHWDASQFQYLLIDRISGVAWTIEEHEPHNPKSTLKVIGKGNYAGFNCVTHELSPSSSKVQYSISDSIFFPFSLPDSMRATHAGKLPSFLVLEKQTIPLRIQRTTPEGTIITQATTVSRLEPDPSVFRMPSGYDVKPFDRLVRFHPLVPKPKRAED